MLKHGGSHTRAFRIWGGMRSRCNNPNVRSYQRYGGRGIKVCARWDDFAAFLKDMGEPPPDGSIDRIDNDLGYEPSNCRWVSMAAQARNKRTVQLVDGLTRPQFATTTGVGYDALLWRMKKMGLTAQEAAAYKHAPSQPLVAHGLVMAKSEWAKLLGISKSTISNRLKAGWSIERVVTEAHH